MNHTPYGLHLNFTGPNDPKDLNAADSFGAQRPLASRSFSSRSCTSPKQSECLGSRSLHASCKQERPFWDSKGLWHSGGMYLWDSEVKQWYTNSCVFHFFRIRARSYTGSQPKHSICRCLPGTSFFRMNGGESFQHELVDSTTDRGSSFKCFSFRLASSNIWLNPAKRSFFAKAGKTMRRDVSFVLFRRRSSKKGTEKNRVI